MDLAIKSAEETIQKVRDKAEPLLEDMRSKIEEVSFLIVGH